MTDSIEIINAGVDYSTGDVLPAATINSVIGNAQVAHAVSLSQWSPFVMSVAPVGVAVSQPVWNGEFLSINCMTAAGAQYAIEEWPGGGTAYRTITGLPASTPLVIGYDAAAVEFVAMKSATAAGALYVSGDATFAAWTTYALAGISMTALGFYALTSTNRFFCGSSAGDGAVLQIGATTATSVVTNTNTPELSSVVGNGSTRLVAVGIGAVSYSADSGANWTHIALTAPVTAIGYPRVVWDASRSLFVQSMALSTGEMIWSTSPTGATWQAWRSPASLMIPALLMGGAESGGIGVFGSTWVAPYVTGTSVSTALTGVMFSIDAGASWRCVSGSEQMPYHTQIECMALGNRCAIVSQAGVIFGGDIVSSELENSAAV